MKSTDLRNARRRLGLTQHGLASALSMGKHGWQSISAWERGERPIPGPAQVALKLMLEKRNGGA